MPGVAGPELLSLEQAVALTLRHNFAWQISALEPEIAREALAAEEAAFDTELFASARVAQSDPDSVLSTATAGRTDSRAYQAGARKRLATGATVTAQTNLDRFDSRAGGGAGSLSQTADLALSLRQPLLSGFGPEVNRAGIERARAGLSASQEALRETVLAVLAETERAYWETARLQEQLLLNQSSLNVAEALLDEARERARVGVATQVDVLQAEAARAQRVEEIIETSRALGDAFDRLFALTGTLDQQSRLALEEAFQVAPLPDGGEALPDFERVWRLALLRDPALGRQEALITQREWDRTVARSALRPNLDLVLTGAWSGVDDDKARTAYDRAIEGEGAAWAAGVEFSMPWGRRAGHAGLRAADRRIEQELIRLEELRQALFRNVRSAWRALQSVQKSMAAARLTVSLQEAVFEREQEKYAQGLSAFRDVLRAQSDLDQARIRLLQSKFNQLSSEIALARLSGDLLGRHGLGSLIPQAE